MEKIYEDLIELLKRHDGLFGEDGRLNKNRIEELSYKNDEKLIELLLSVPKFKKLFFFQVKGVTLFDKEKFIDLTRNKNFLEDSYSRFRNRIGLANDDEFLVKRQEVVLNWRFKDCILEGGMTREEKGRKEIFWNKTIAPEHVTRLKSPKAFTNGKIVDAKGSKQFKSFNRGEKGGAIEDNLIIKGNNLLALHSLKEQFTEKVKLIYIDPPYNTGGSLETFTYNNSFNHPSWLTFMKNRLEVAKSLLRDDGFIVVAIDHCELFYLGTLMDEIFDRDNRLGIVSVLSNPRGRQFADFFAPSTEYMLVYASNKKRAEFNQITIDEEKRATFDQEDEKGLFRYKSFIRKANIENKLKNERDKYCYPIYVSQDLKEITTEAQKGFHKVVPVLDEKEYCWDVQKSKFKKNLEAGEGEYVAKRDGRGAVHIFKKYREQQMFLTHWFDKKYNATFHGTRMLEKIMGKKTVSYVKSIHTIKDVLKIMTSGNDLIIDFFAGSGTTGHAALEVNREDGGNRQFILVEQLDMHIDTCVERLKKVIASDQEGETGTIKFDEGESFVYLELAEWNQMWVREVGKAKTKKQIQTLCGEIKKHAFLDFRIDEKKFNESVNDFNDLSLEEQKKFLLDSLDANHFYINYSEIEDRNYSMKKADKELSYSFYRRKES